MIAPVALAAALALALSGCGATTPAATTTATPTPASISVPPGGELLRDYGLSNAPANLAVPAGLVISGTVDQPNVVTLVTTSVNADVPGFLRDRLAGWGYRIEADANGSIIFTNDAWEGAWTCSSTECGLTVRNLLAAPVKRGS